jgi:hypothetical protein
VCDKTNYLLLLEATWKITQSVEAVLSMCNRTGYEGGIASITPRHPMFIFEIFYTETNNSDFN